MLFFAGSRDLTGFSESSIELPTSLTAKELRNKLLEHFTALVILFFNILIFKRAKCIRASKLDIQQTGRS